MTYHKLVGKSYQLQIGEPYWMPEAEIGIGIGRYQGTFGNHPMELLGWFNRKGDRILTSEEKAAYLQTKLERLAARLRELGEDPELLP